MPLRDWHQGDSLSAAHWQEAVDVCRTVENITADGCDVVQGPGGVTIYSHPAPPPPVIRAFFNARITGHTQDGSSKRFTYSVEEVEKTSAGYGGWTVKSGGRTGTAYNRTENQNGASGTFGNGWSSSDFTGTQALAPAPDNLIVSAEAVTLTDGTTEYWFSYENGISGKPANADATTVTVQTDYRFDAATLKLQKKTRTAYAPDDSVESAWTDVHQAASCTGG